MTTTTMTIETHGVTVIVRAHRPELTEEERRRRMAEIAEAAADLIRAADRAKRRKDEHNGE